MPKTKKYLQSLQESRAFDHESKARKEVTSREQSSSDDEQSQSLQATVVSVFTKIIDKDTNITYALLKSEKETLYAAWRNSYFARDIMVHRKYTFSGKMRHIKDKTYFADPTFIDIPVVQKYFDFALAPPSDSPQPKSAAAKVALGLIMLSVLAGITTVALNSETVEQALVGRNQEVSVRAELPTSKD